MGDFDECPKHDLFEERGKSDRARKRTRTKTKTFKPSKRAYVLVHSETTEKFK